VVLLPEVAGSEQSILPVHAPYRVEGSRLHLRIAEPAKGSLQATLWAYVGYFPSRLLWRSPPMPYEGPCVFSHDLDSGEVSVGTTRCGLAPRVPGRRFCWELEFSGSGVRRKRMTGHYVPGEGAVDDTYYSGANYVDHEAESAGDVPHVLRLLRAHEAQGPILEIGCATGGLLKTLLEAGYDAAGVDISEWAVARAHERIGENRAALCNFEVEALPEAISRRGPFRTLILWAVLEHFTRPLAVISKLGEIAVPGSTLVINTSNCRSLTHLLFGRDWEGYFDWTHHGVDQVSPECLRQALVSAGWQVRELRTSMVWDSAADPSHATLRDWWNADARFRQMVAERELGDFLTCVAVRQ
jgi:2-polyprenyl-3-methyl-5-hydroxy-6-metoxy-1,4-benzoquinol methylase